MEIANSTINITARSILYLPMVRPLRNKSLQRSLLLSRPGALMGRASRSCVAQTESHRYLCFPLTVVKHFKLPNTNMERQIQGGRPMVRNYYSLQIFN